MDDDSNPKVPRCFVSDGRGNVCSRAAGHDGPHRSMEDTWEWPSPKTTTEVRMRGPHPPIESTMAVRERAEGKDLFSSKTTWGALFLLATPTLRALGIDVDEESLMAFIDAVATRIGGGADTMLTILGAAIVIWGQVSRKTRIASILGIRLSK